MITHCPTKVAVYLVHALDERGVLRIYNDGQSLPGLVCENDPNTPIVDQLAPTLKDRIDLTGSFSVDDRLCETILGTEASLLLVSIEGVAKDSWWTMPELLRGMGATRSRLNYLKAWQILSGASQEMIQAIEKKDLLEH